MENTMLVHAELGGWNPSELAFIEMLAFEGTERIVRMTALFQTRSRKWPDPKQPFLRVSMRFEGVSQFQLKDWSGVTQIMGFDIVGIDRPGWEDPPALHVRDYEDGKIEFFARAARVLEVDWLVS